MKWRRLLLLLAVGLPQFMKQAIYRSMGWKIGKNVRVGLSYIEAKHVILEDGVTIGNFNHINGLRLFHLGKDVYFKNFNQAAGVGHLEHPSALIIAEKTLVMSHHFFDCFGTVRIGSRVTVGGRDTHFWSHTLHFDETGKPTLSPLTVTIGDEVYVGARVTLVGCSVPPGTVIAAGSVVVKQHEAELTRIMLAGNPATVKKRYDIPAPAPVPATIAS